MIRRRLGSKPRRMNAMSAPIRAIATMPPRMAEPIRALPIEAAKVLIGFMIAVAIS